jgi:hypothetical protein
MQPQSMIEIHAIADKFVSVAAADAAAGSPAA